MTTRKVTIHITQEHIDKSRYWEVDECAVALAMESYFNKPCFLRLTRGTLAVLHGAYIPITDHVRELYTADCNCTLQPCTFELECPEDWFL